jgi:hypothetical protein
LVADRALWAERFQRFGQAEFFGVLHCVQDDSKGKATTKAIATARQRQKQRQGQGNDKSNGKGKATTKTTATARDKSKRRSPSEMTTRRATTKATTRQILPSFPFVSLKGQDDGENREQQ